MCVEVKKEAKQEDTDVNNNAERKNEKMLAKCSGRSLRSHLMTSSRCTMVCPGGLKPSQDLVLCARLACLTQCKEQPIYEQSSQRFLKPSCTKVFVHPQVQDGLSEGLEGEPWRLGVCGRVQIKIRSLDLPRGQACKRQNQDAAQDFAGRRG